MNLNQEIEHWLVSSREQFHCVHRPHVTLCYAQGWDGSITIRAGESLVLSNDESTRLTHQLRSMHDGIMVGIGTVLTDDPQLTVREWSGSSPQPIVLDSHLRIPATARLCKLAGRRCWVLTTLECPVENDDGPEYIKLHGDGDGRVDLHEALGVLAHKGIRSLMVEGGANVISAFLREQLADALVLTIAPTLIGGYRAVNDLGYSSQQQLPQISPLYTGRMGDDLIMWGNLQYGAPRHTDGQPDDARECEALHDGAQQDDTKRDDAQQGLNKSAGKKYSDKKYSDKKYSDKKYSNKKYGDIPG